MEDDSIIRGLIKEVLVADYFIQEASNCAEAFEWRAWPDLLIVDYSLPDGNGLDVLRAIRRKKPTLPVILITAYGHEDLAIKSLRLSVNDYLKKPVSLILLKKRVVELIEGGGKTEPQDFAESNEAFLMDGVAAFIENHYPEELSWDALARKVAIDRYTLSKAFKKRHGQTIKSYINRTRVKKAVELLANPSLSVTEVAHFVGYRSIDHFERVFRSAYGKSPKSYREEKLQTAVR